MRTEQIEHAPRLRSHMLAIEHAETRDFAAEKQAFGDGQMVGKIEFLMDDDDAERFRSAVRRQLDRLTIKEDFARGRLLETGKDLDEGRLAGAILAHESVDLASAKIKVDAEQHLHAVEGLGYPSRRQHDSTVDGFRTH